MMVKSGLEKIFWKFLHAASYFYYWICDFGHFYEVRESSLPHGGISKIFFLDHFSPSFYAKNCIFGYRFHFAGKTDVWISQVRRVNWCKNECFWKRTTCIGKQDWSYIHTSILKFAKLKQLEKEIRMIWGSKGHRGCPRGHPGSRGLPGVHGVQGGNGVRVLDNIK